MPEKQKSSVLHIKTPVFKLFS